MGEKVECSTTAIHSQEATFEKSGETIILTLELRNVPPDHYNACLNMLGPMLNDLKDSFLKESG